MKKLFNNPLFCRKLLSSIALALATTSLIMPVTSFAQNSPGEQGAVSLTTRQSNPRGDGGCDSTCSLDAPPPVSQACVLHPEVRTINCSPPNSVGTISQKRSPVYCNGAIVSGGAWVNISNNCVASVCTSTNSTQTIACPAGYSGSIDQSKTDTSCNDGTSTSGIWTTTANNCMVISCGPTSPDATADCGPGFNSGLVTTVYSMSAAPACTQTSLVFNTCLCSLTPSATLIACPTPYIGNYTVTKTPNMTTCTYGTTDDSVTACAAAVSCVSPTPNFERTKTFCPKLPPYTVYQNEGFWYNFRYWDTSICNWGPWARDPGSESACAI